MAIFPGMEELSALLYVNHWQRKRYDVIVLDCAPTGESLRFVAMPTTMKWYMAACVPGPTRIVESGAADRQSRRAVRAAARQLFCRVKDCSSRIDGIDELLEDPRVTSVRLVTNAEKMVVRETQRAFVYFSMHGLTVDQVLVNRVLPDGCRGSDFFREWRRTQEKFLKEIEAYFAPVPMRCVPLFRHEVLGLERHSRAGPRDVRREGGSGRR